MSQALRKLRQEMLAKELEELKGQTPEQEEEKKIQTPVEGDPEEETFRKRYGDLRRHAQKREEELQAQINELNARVNEKQIVFPKTEEEIDNWRKKYPDLYDVLETIILKTAHKEKQGVEERLKKVDDLEAELKEARARAVLIKAHPDFPDIAQTEEFHKWLETKPKAIRDIMYEPNQDVNDAIDIVSMYKDLIGSKTKKAEKPARDNSAAIKTPSASRSTPSFEGEHIFSESEVRTMNEREYSKNRAEIMKQQANGKFIYDISGAAR